MTNLWTACCRRVRSIPVARALVAAMVLLSTSSLRAQPVLAAMPGTRIRIELPSTERSRIGRVRPQSVVGTLGGVFGDTVLLIVGGSADPLRVPFGATQSFYSSGGRPRRWQAALRGALFPALSSAAVTAVSASITRGTDDRTRMQRVTTAAAWGAASGAVLGAWSPKERWHRLKDAQPSAAVAEAGARDE